jgi:hypothetical protein
MKKELKKFYIQEGEYWTGYYIVAKNINIALEVLKKENEISQDITKEECYICQEVDINEGDIILEENEYEIENKYEQ